MKYPRTYHLPFSQSKTSDDKISNSVSNLLGKKIVITEKLDGENTAMVNNGVYARSHATFTTSPWSVEVRKIHDIKVRGYLSNDVYIFGENMEGVHSIEYKNLDSYFYIFGVKDNNKWLSWDKVVEYSYLLDLPTVPVLFEGILESESEMQKIVDDLIKNNSKLGDQIEGIVIRNYESFYNDDFNKNIMKWVRKDHVKTDKHWTKNWTKSKLKHNQY